MVKKYIIFFFIIVMYSCFSQGQNNLWWLQTSTNKKYEDNYRRALSDIKDDELRIQIESFIETYLTYTNKKDEEIAVEVTLLHSKNKDEKVYGITYVSDYYGIISAKMDVQQIAVVENRIVFFRASSLDEIRINKKLIFGLLRARYPVEARKLNEQFKKYKKEGDDIIPVIIGRLEHNIPHWNIRVENGKVVDKEITYDEWHNWD